MITNRREFIKAGIMMSLPLYGVTNLNSAEKTAKPNILIIFTDDQGWFWTPEWQAEEREADRDIREGNIKPFQTLP